MVVQAHPKAPRGRRARGLWALLYAGSVSVPLILAAFLTYSPHEYTPEGEVQDTSPRSQTTLSAADFPRNRKTPIYPPLQQVTFHQPPQTEASSVPPQKVVEASLDTIDRYEDAFTGHRDDDGSTRITSHVTIRGTPTMTGKFKLGRWRFENVHLSSSSNLDVFVPPGVNPPRPHIADFVHLGRPILPTTLAYRNINSQCIVRLNVSYLPAATAQPPCTRWEERPVYLLPLPQPTNVWHVWHDGLLLAFAALREEGLLPLAEVDAAGNVREYVDDLDDECPWVMEHRGKNLRREASCRPLQGVITEKKCSKERQPWCVPTVGGLVAVNRSAGPIFLLAKASTPPLKHWRPMFEAVSEDIREWKNEVGTCFRELYVGGSNLLNFYVTVTPRPTKSGNRTRKLRLKALEAFQRLQVTALRGPHGKIEDALLPKGRYADPAVERLRAGVGPEDIDALEVLTPKLKDAYKEFYKLDEYRLMKIKLKASEAAVKKLVQSKPIPVQNTQEMQLEDGANPGVVTMLMDLNVSVAVKESPMPVVTYMWRPGFSRSVLNARDVLSYVLLRYNVTVKVTTFEEPVLDIIDLMNTTDVLLGMHGAGWTNAIFLKRGAGALQLMPYGWVRPETAKTPRGTSYRNIVLYSGGHYAVWGNQDRELAFVRRRDTRRRTPMGCHVPFSLHPDPTWPFPLDQHSCKYWVYQNTVVNIEDFGRVLDNLMASMGIQPMNTPGATGREEEFPHFTH